MGRYGEKNPIVKPDDMAGVYRKRRRSEGRRRVYFGGDAGKGISGEKAEWMGRILLGIAISFPVFFGVSYLISLYEGGMGEVSGFFWVLSWVAFILVNMIVVVGSFVTDHSLKKCGLSMLIVWGSPLVFAGISMGWDVFRRLL